MTAPKAVGNWRGGLPELGVKRPWLVVVMNLSIILAGIAALLAVEVR